jgi:hypothetical protein
MKYAALLVLCGTICFAEQVEKPVCDARSRGRFWPEEANFSQDAARQFFERGDLEMCALAAKKYRWERLSVNVHDLTKGRRASTSESKKAVPKESK